MKGSSPGSAVAHVSQQGEVRATWGKWWQQTNKLACGVEEWGHIAIGLELRVSLPPLLKFCRTQLNWHSGVWAQASCCGLGSRASPGNRRLWPSLTQHGLSSEQILIMRGPQRSQVHLKIVCEIFTPLWCWFKTWKCICLWIGWVLQNEGFKLPSSFHPKMLIRSWDLGLKLFSQHCPCQNTWKAEEGTINSETH